MWASDGVSAAERSSQFPLWSCFNRNKLALGLLNDDSRVCLSVVQLLFPLRDHLVYVKTSAEKWDVTVGDSEWECKEDFQDTAENAEITLYTGA